MLDFNLMDATLLGRKTLNCFYGKRFERLRAGMFAMLTDERYVEREDADFYQIGLHSLGGLGRSTFLLPLDEFFFHICYILSIAGEHCQKGSSAN